MPSIFNRVHHAWNAFMNKDPTLEYTPRYGDISYIRPDKTILGTSNERSLVTAVLNRISVDVAACQMHHVLLDDQERYLETLPSGLEECLNVSANVDQTGTAFRQDIALSLLDEGNIAIVPIDYDDDPEYGTKFEINSMRVGQITEWMPREIKVLVYNEITGRKEEIVVPKSDTEIIENPFYAVMNEPNSLAKRISRKLTLLDYVDEQNGSGKLDLIVQLPYVVKTPGKKNLAEERRTDIEMQLSNSKYGIAYIDGTEKIVQLNRAIENQLLPQIKELKYMWYSQLGITDEIMNGTADERTLNNYYQRTIVPILTAITEGMVRTFLTKEARTFKMTTDTDPVTGDPVVDPETGEEKRIKTKESIKFFNDPFKLIPTSQLADITDKFTRNEVMTPNEIRQSIGIKPSKDPKADELRNRNISMSNDQEMFDRDGNNITDTIRKE